MTGIRLKERRGLSPMEQAVLESQDYFGDMVLHYAEACGVSGEEFCTGSWEPTNEQAKECFMEALDLAGYRGDYEEAWEWAINNDMCYMCYKEEDNARAKD